MKDLKKFHHFNVSNNNNEFLREKIRVKNKRK